MRIGVDIRRKGKMEKINGVCRKNKESAGRSRDSIGKSIRKDKVISS